MNGLYDVHMLTVNARSGLFRAFVLFIAILFLTLILSEPEWLNSIQIFRTPAASAKTKFEIRIQTVNDVPFVLATICGKPIWLCIDTGGEVSQLPDSFLSCLKVRSTGSISNANGVRKSSLCIPVDIIIDGQEIKKFEATVVGSYTNANPGANWYVDTPTLGLNALCQYRVVLDGHRGKLSLLDDDSPPSGENWVAFEGFFGSLHQTVLATSKSDGRQVRAFFDTGMDFSRTSKSILNEADGTISILVGETCVVAKPRDILDGKERVIEWESKGSKKRVETDCALGWDVLKHYCIEISFKYRKLRVLP